MISRFNLGAAALVAVALATAPAVAQPLGGPTVGPAVPAPGGPPSDLTVGPDEEVLVREYIVRRRSAPVRLEGDGRLRPGSIVPGYVELEPLVDVRDPRLRRLAYFVSPDDKIVMVDPVTREVVRIVER